MAEEAAKPAEGEAPAEGAAPAEGEAAPAGGKKKMLMIVSAVVAVVGLIVAGGVFFLMGGEKKDAHAEGATEVPEVAVVDVPEFALNLMSEDPANQRFIKTKISLELANVADAPALEKLMPRLQDDWGGFLRQLRPMDMQGTAALQRLKEGLLRRANQSLSPVQVKAVYVRELLVQ